MKKLAALTAISAFLVTPVMAEQLYSFGSLSANYLDWDANQDNLPFIELEGGAGYTWGELYGFYDFENPLSGDKSNFFKGQADFNLTGNWMAHTHVAAGGDDYGIDFADYFAGIAYKFSGDNGAFFKPYLAARVTKDNSGLNGYQFGFAWSYPTMIAGQKITFAQWHETDFARDDAYWGANDDIGHNGAISAWWNATDAAQLGVQYRYVDNGYSGNAGDNYLDGVIATVKYNF